jgi:hypothetical protein
MATVIQYEASFPIQSRLNTIHEVVRTDGVIFSILPVRNQEQKDIADQIVPKIQKAQNFFMGGFSATPNITPPEDFPLRLPFPVTSFEFTIDYNSTIVGLQDDEPAEDFSEPMNHLAVCTETPDGFSLEVVTLHKLKRGQRVEGGLEYGLTQLHAYMTHISPHVMQCRGEMHLQAELEKHPKDLSFLLQGEVQLVAAVSKKVLSALVLLNSENITSEVIRPNPKFVKARAKKGKSAPPNYRVLKVLVPKAKVVHEDGAELPEVESDYEKERRKSPRLHVRRGHVRHFKNGKTRWIEHMVIGTGRASVDKDYRLIFEGE